MSLIKKNMSKEHNLIRIAFHTYGKVQVINIFYVYALRNLIAEVSELYNSVLVFFLQSCEM